MDNLSALIGICMAAAGTGTRVFGVNIESNAENTRIGSLEEDYGNSSRSFDSWARPVDALSWSVFTTPGLLSAVFTVGQEMTEAASRLLV